VSANRPEPHTLAGAYALDSLDGRNRARFERHMARCVECAGEVSGLREATARLAAAAAAPPPAALKERLLAQTARTRQLPPVTRQTRAAPPRLSPAPGLPGRAGTRRGGPGQRRVRPVWAACVALGLAAIVVLAGVWTTARPGQSPGMRPPRSAALAKVLTAPDATVISGQVRTGGTATVVMSRRDGMLVFAAAGLRAVPSSRRYELWLLAGGKDMPAGLLPVAVHGMTGPVTASGLRSGYRLGLSVEPAHGSRHPTSPMILVLAL
jgi:anti-sigma-K factor RskA